jgi:HK97 family phage prohead protease
MTTTTQSPLSTGTLEHRTYSTKLEARDVDGMQFRLSGYASVTSSPYSMGSYDETIAPGAFTRTLALRPDVQLLVNHEGLPLARTTNGSLTLTADDKGLKFDAGLDRDDGDARLLMRKISSGLLDQCSFAFRVIDLDWNSDRTLRTINEVSLDRGDVSVVNYGASAVTSVQARAALRRQTSNLSLYQYRARALALKGRTRHLSILNEAGRRR